MPLTKIKTMIIHEGEGNLPQISWDLTVQGVVLTIMAYFARGGIDGAAVTIICGYLAGMFLVRMLFSGFTTQKNFWGRAGALTISILFCWWLLYTAENTRVGWYRYNILQSRVQQLVAKAPAYIIIADTRGVITTTSDNIEMLVGYTKQELIGQPVTILMRESKIPKHRQAFEKMVAVLRDPSKTNSGWALQGVLTVGVLHKDGHLVPVQVYAGGIRWSREIQFDQDTDIFAVFVPVEEKTAREQPTTIPSSTPLQEAPQPPTTPPITK